MGLQEGGDRALRDRKKLGTRVWTLGRIRDGGAISIRASLAGGWDEGRHCQEPQAFYWSPCCPSKQWHSNEVLRMEREVDEATPQ